MFPKSLYASRRSGTRVAAFSSVGIRPGMPTSSDLRVDAARRIATTGTHLNDAKRKELGRHDTGRMVIDSSLPDAVGGEDAR